jgi:hypothetical protein
MAETEILPRKHGTVIINGRVCPFTAPDPTVMKKVTRVIKKAIKDNGGEYPEDTWVEFTLKGVKGIFDLNIWTDDETGERKASVHRVIPAPPLDTDMEVTEATQRTTDTSDWERIASGYIPTN